MTTGKTFLAAVLSVAFSASSAGAADWQNMTPAQFPAQVRSVSFATGHVIDRDRWVSWGAWTVRFGDRAPVAQGTRMSKDGSLGFIAIEGLKCMNRVVGESECVMRLWPLRHRANIPCSIEGDKMPTIGIECPAGVELE